MDSRSRTKVIETLHKRQPRGNNLSKNIKVISNVTEKFYLQ